MRNKSAYIAAPFGQKDDARSVRAILARYGIDSTARWIDSHLDDNIDDKQKEKEAIEDLRDVHRADIFVLLNYPDYPATPGRAIETGYAIAARKPIFLIGEPSSIFHHLDIITKVTGANDVGRIVNEGI